MRQSYICSALVLITTTLLITMHMVGIEMHITNILFILGAVTILYILTEMGNISLRRSYIDRLNCVETTAFRNSQVKRGEIDPSSLMVVPESDAVLRGKGYSVTGMQAFNDSFALNMLADLYEDEVMSFGAAVKSYHEGDLRIRDIMEMTKDYSPEELELGGDK